jgi:DNA polymerase III subunit delta'
MTFAPRENPHLIGQEAAERAVLEALGGGRLHHAWLITGPEGVGKATLAYRFARRLFAGGSDTLAMDPTHPVFRRVAAGSHADLLTVEREWDDKKKRMKKNIAAESVREIPGFLHLTPAEGGWRVVIVDGAEDMNMHSANALLKVLEEPPNRAVLMLVSAAPGRLLPTIRSRCRHLALEALNGEQLGRTLALYLPDMGAAERQRLAAMAQGSPGRALALAEQGGVQIAALVTEVLEALPGFPVLRAYEMADKLKEEAAFELFFALLRGAIASALTANLRGAADAMQSRLANLRGTAEWGALWSRLGDIQRETDQHNLDRRQAVVAGLSLLR